MTWTQVDLIPRQFVDSSGNTLSGAYLKAYRAGTTTAISMSNSFSGATTTSQLITNSLGYLTLSGNITRPFINEAAKLILYPNQTAADANDTGSAIWVVDNVKGIGFGTTQNVDTITALKALDTATYTRASTGGYTTLGDGGAGNYYFSSGSVASANNVTVIAPNSGSGRWLLIHDGEVNIRQAGAHPSASAATNTTALAACMALGASDSVYYISIPAGTYLYNPPLNLKDYMTLTGVSREKSILKKNANGDGLTTGDYDGGVDRRDRVSLLHFGIDGDGKTGSGIIFSHNHYWLIEDVYVTGCNGSSTDWALKVYGSWTGNCFGFYHTANYNGIYVFNQANALTFVGTYGSNANALGTAHLIGGCSNISWYDMKWDTPCYHYLHLVGYVRGMHLHGLYLECQENQPLSFPIYAIATDADQLARNVVINGLMMILNDADDSTIWPVHIRQHYNNVTMRDLFFRITSSTADLETQPVIQLGLNGTTPLDLIELENVYVEDATQTDPGVGTRIVAIEQAVTRPKVEDLNGNRYVRTNALRYGGIRMNPDNMAYERDGSPLSNGQLPLFVGQKYKDLDNNNVWESHDTTALDWVNISTYHYDGSMTWNPGSIADGGKESVEVTVTGAALGDFVTLKSFSLDVQDLILDAQVTAANTVTVVLANNTGGAIDLASGTIYVRVLKL